MVLKIEISGELESALQAQAREQGLTADGVAQRVLAAALTPVVKLPASTIPQLPTLHLGDLGALRRRDLYDDAR